MTRTSDLSELLGPAEMQSDGPRGKDTRPITLNYGAGGPCTALSVSWAGERHCSARHWLTDKVAVGDQDLIYVQIIHIAATGEVECVTA